MISKSLLEASGISGEDENGATSFDEKIRQLAIAALAGKDMTEEIACRSRALLMQRVYWSERKKA